jgi:hypothetical protein
VGRGVEIYNLHSRCALSAKVWITSDLPANCQYPVRALAHEAETRRVTA